MEIKNVTIIGLGALGILYANHLTKYLPKANVRIVADRERIARYQREGVYCNGKRCDFYYIPSDEPCEPADLLLFTVKIHGLKDAIRAVRNHVGKNTIILSALNGITSEKIIADAYGKDRVLLCVAQGMDAVKTGNQLTYENMGKLVFGDETPGIISRKSKAVAEFFEKVKMPYEIDTNMKKRLWGKFMLNVGVNQVVAVYQGNYGLIHKDGPARQLMIDAMKEVITLSEKEGENLTEEDLYYWLSVLDRLSPRGKPSMAQDIEAKRFTEVDLFAGTAIELGKKHNVPTPVNDRLYAQIKQMEKNFPAN